MQIQEQELILDLSNRLQETATIEKDSVADELIQRNIANQKDVVYRLVQAVLLQQMALKQAQQNLTFLQTKVQQLETQQATQKPTSFLGGLTEKLFGQSTTSSAIPNRPVSGSTSGASLGVSQPPQQGQSQNYGQNPNATNVFSQSQPAAAGNSFLGSAISTAMGVAGGMFLFQGLHNLMSPSTSAFGASGNVAGTDNSVTNNYFSDTNSNASILDTDVTSSGLPDPTIHPDAENVSFDNDNNATYDNSFDSSLSDDFGGNDFDGGGDDGDF